MSTEAPRSLQFEDESVAPEPKGINMGTAAPEAIMSIKTVPEEEPAGAKPQESSSIKSADVGPAGGQQHLPAKRVIHPAPTKAQGAEQSAELWTINSIKGHRWRGDSIELQIKCDDGCMSWEPEISIQEDAPSVLFSYWASKGGRPPHPEDPDLFHIFAIRKVKARGHEVFVEWVGYEERTWEPRSTVEDAAPDMLKEFEALHGRARKRRR